MSIHLILNLLDFHLFNVELHLLSILYTIHISTTHPFYTLCSDHDLLNFSANVAGLAAIAFGSSFTSIVIVDRALGGSIARKFRAVLPDLGLKGEKAVTTEVMYLVIMMATVLMAQD